MTTFTNLKADILRYTEDSSPDFTAALTRIIKQGEARVMKDLDVEMFIGNTQGNVNTSLITAPSGLIAVESLRIDGRYLDPRSEEYCLEYNAGAPNGPPLYYHQRLPTQIRVCPVPDQSYLYTLRFRQAPTGLSNNVTSTWFSEHFGDGLLYACLMESEGFLKADTRVPMWTEAYTSAVESFKQQYPELLRKTYP